MKVFLDARSPPGGIGRRVDWLRRGLSRKLKSDERVFFGTNRQGEGEPPADRALPRAALGAVKRLVTDQWVLPRAAMRSGADLFHSPNYLVPRRLGVPAVVDCHDLTLLDSLETKKRGVVKHYERWILRDGIRRARCVVTPSDTTRHALLQRFDLDPSHVVTIYPPAPDWLGTPAASPVAATPYLLTVGTLEPRKNLGLLLAAHQRVWRRTRVSLLVVGGYGWRQRRLVQRMRRSDGAVRWLGWVPDFDLANLYHHAAAVVQVSLAEGFDLPVQEALAAGRPLVLSDIPVHREVAGERGLYAPADDAVRLAERCLEALSWGSRRRAEHRARAIDRVRELAARSGIDRYLEVYRLALADGG